MIDLPTDAIEAMISGDATWGLTEYGFDARLLPANTQLQNLKHEITRLRIVIDDYEQELFSFKEKQDRDRKLGIRFDTTDNGDTQ